MKRTLAFILTAVMLLGMIPSTFLSALAVGAGVKGNGIQNQSQDIAKDQYIPETVIVDGVVDTDTAWANHKWNEVNTYNGTWDKEKPDADNKEKLNYKFQLHYDYEYFYGAIVLGKDVKDAVVTIWLNDLSNVTGTDENGNTTYGYSHKITYTVSGGNVTDGGMVKHDGTVISDANVYASQKYLVAYGNGDKTTIEFRRYLASFTSAKPETVEYFISVKYNGDTLYFPRVQTDASTVTFRPDFTFWPAVADLDSNHLDHQQDMETISPIQIDGKFDEAVWSGLTNYHYSDGSSVSNITFDNVGYNDTYQPSANSSSDVFLNEYKGGKFTGSTGTISLNNSRGKGEVKFKYLYRIDGEYIYFAIIAEVPELMYGAMNVEGKKSDTESSVQTVRADPTLTIYFYNQTGKAFDANGKPATLNSTYNNWVPEHLLSLNTANVNEKTNANGLVNIGPRVDGDGYIDGVRWSEEETDDTYGQNNYEINGVVNPDYISAKSAWSKQDTYYDEVDTYKSGGKEYAAESSIWHFESCIKLEHIMSSKAKKANADKGLKPGDEGFDVGDLKFSISVSDRPWIEPFQFADKDTEGKAIKGYRYYTDYAKGEYVVAKNYYRSSAWTGTDFTIENYPFYDHKNAIDISNTQPKGDYISGITVDAKFDKQNNAELIAADSRINGADRIINAQNASISSHGKYNNGGYDIPSTENGLLPYGVLNNKFQYKPYTGIQYAYNVTADHEYLYFAVAAKNLKALDTFRIWVTKPGSTNKFDHAVEFNFTGKGIGYASWWSGSGANETDKHTDFSFNSVLNGSVLCAEVRIALSELGITPTLTPNPNDLLFTYYFSIEDYSTRNGVSSNYGLISPRPQHGEQGYYANADPNFAGKIHYNVPDAGDIAGFDHYDGLMLDYIRIDGKLEEEIWNDNSDRITVNGETGKWYKLNETNNPFDYSYVIYSGDNFIYGAVEIGVTADKKDSANDSSYTNVELWLDNAGSFDKYGTYSSSGLYENYLYSIYLYDSSYSKNGPSGQVYGGSSPSADHSGFDWNMSTANGKTYVEFMISTDNKDHFIVNENIGFNYFIRVNHPDNGNESSLIHPAPENMFYLTHYNNFSVEGAGVIFTRKEDYNDYASVESNQRWWDHVSFKPATVGGEFAWEIVDISYGSAKGQGKALTIPEGGFVYAVNSGNNYVNLVETFLKDQQNSGKTMDAFIAGHISGNSKEQWVKHEINAAAHYNYYSVEAVHMIDQIKKWSKGDVLVIPNLNAKAVADESSLGYGTKYQNEVLLTRYEKSTRTHKSKINGSTDIYEYDAKQVYAKPDWHESGYKCNITFSVYSKNEEWDDNLPTASKWYNNDLGKLEKQLHTAPEKIVVDGNLNDTGWAEDGWITVSEDINATHQSDKADDFNLKYQLRNDGEYLYVAAVLEGVKYDAENAPSFTLWTKDGDAANWTDYFRLGYGDSSIGGAKIPEIVDPVYRYQSEDIVNAISGSSVANVNDIFVGLEDNDGVLRKDDETYTVLYKNYLEAVKNVNPETANGQTALLNYHNSALYGFTQTIEEYIKGFYYPDIRMEIQKYVFGTESGIMKGDEAASISGLDNQNGNSTVLEFRVKLDEIDEDGDGFEYFVSAARNNNGKEYALYYPTVYCEPESEFSYYNRNFPFSKWYDTAVIVTADDLKGDMCLANEYAPVISLGAKFSENFQGKGKSIRFGALYKEDYIRRQTGVDTADYWHVNDMGIIILATHLVGEGYDALNLDTPRIAKASAQGIVNWIQDSNFADYESFAFYVTFTGIPENQEDFKFSARPFIDYYNDLSGVAEDYYGQTVIRSINLINEHAGEEILPD